jgi:peptidoglycan/xylan/chitin deacetylase (PgdA/CDA1 family)
MRYISTLQMQGVGSMSNPFAIATQGKGFFPMLRRGKAIISRYGSTSLKIDAALAQLMEILKQFSCQATLPVTAVALKRQSAIAHKYQALGAELALHGLVHVDYSQLDPEIQVDHLRRSRRLFEQVGVHPAGFRCPYLRWSAGTLAALRECGFAYDSSQAVAWDVTDSTETDAYRRVLDFYGAQFASEYPALPRMTDGLVRIPYCLPDDEALVERLRLTDDRAMAEPWLAMLDRTYQAGELFTLGLHPERVPQCQGALRAVLEKARSLNPSVWIARLDEVVAWYLALGQTSFEICQDDQDWSRITLHAPPRAAILVRSLDVKAATQPWADSYHHISENEIIFRSSKRPFIGLSPDCPPALGDFLRHQGYLTEISWQPQAYACYLQRDCFSPEDERPLLTELDQGAWPLVRLARWPGGARCGLAVTGDVDAFTLWDFGRRLWIT